MVSLKWGDILSTLLPGAVALLALAPYFPLLQRELERLDQVGLGNGIALLMAAALAGGVLEALTRITWERYWLLHWCPSKDILGRLAESPQKVDLYERGVQGSYKYVTFYANFALASALLMASRVQQGAAVRSMSTAVLAATIVILLIASHVQWTYYVNYQDKVFGSRSHDAGERSTAGHESSIREGRDERTPHSEHE